jgi:hypothetical protein
MFFWTNKQAIFFLALLILYAALFMHPRWQPWYERMAPIVLIILAVGAFRYALRK